MKYTNQIPTKAGFYFCKCRAMMSGNIYETVVKVYRDREGVPLNMVFWDGENFNLSDSVFTAWAGPIEPPTDSDLTR
jgi:hypothetical protein